MRESILLLYYCVVALVQGHDLYNHIHVSQFTQHTLLIAMWLPTGIIKDMTLNKSYLVSRILSLTYYTLLLLCKTGGESYVPPSLLSSMEFYAFE